MTLFDEYHKLKKRSVSEWRDTLSAIQNQTRDQVQKHGEVAALAGFVAGVLVVVFFKLFCWLLFIMFVLAALIWLKAPDTE